MKIQSYADPYYTETLTGKGGVAVFAKRNVESFEREDLKICNREFEGVWIEIKKAKI